MLGSAVQDQLKQHFSELGFSIALVYGKSSHDKQAELVQLLEDVASTSKWITAKEDARTVDIPRFEIWRNEVHTGVSFRGVPGGHEFTSLVLAILHACEKGKRLDDAIVARIKRLKIDRSLTTYMSLSCENCPDVVQAMNQITIVHEGMSHETIDGGLVQGEIEELGIQGVPTVLVDNRMLHTGRGTLGALLSALESEFEIDEQKMLQHDLGRFDMVVIGGGPAGASAAIYSARKGLSTALIADRIGGQMQETKGVENFISVVYTEGPALSANLLDHLKEYPVRLLEHRRAKQVKPIVGGGFIISLDSGESVVAEALLVATGSKWRKLGVPGEVDYLGRGVAYCPHCDGPYYRDKAVAVVGGGNSGVEAALDLAEICEHVTLLEYAPQLGADHVLISKLKNASNITVISHAETMKILGDGNLVTALQYRDRNSGSIQSIDVKGVFVQIGLSPNSELIKELVETSQSGEIITDVWGRTSLQGIYAAGDVTTVPYKQIIIALGEGAKAALAAFEDRLIS